MSDYYTTFDYHRPLSLVVADGAALVTPGGVKSIDMESLAKYLQEDESGPRVSLQTVEGEATSLGCHWVDSAEKEGFLREIGVYKYFNVILYKNAGSGGQTAEVDACIQSLIRRSVRRSNTPEHEFTDHVTILLLAGDGDHAKSLESAIEGHSISRTVHVWVAGWMADMSEKLKGLTKKPERPPNVIDLARFKHNGYASSDASITISHNTPSLKQVVATAFPVYEESCNVLSRRELLRNAGLQGLLTASWETLCAPTPRHAAKVFIVTGDTGCGKTTQIPQLLYDQMLYAYARRDIGRTPRILCVQPRRLATKEIYARVVDERKQKRGHLPWYGETVGDIGYMIGGDVRCTKSTPIVFCTDGMLRKQLTSASEGDWDVLIIDEAHERSTGYDLLLSLVLTPSMLTGRRIVLLMSATMDKMQQQLRRYAIDCLASYQGEAWYQQPADLVQAYCVTEPYNDAAAVSVPFRDYPQAPANKFACPIFYLDDILPGPHPACKADAGDQDLFWETRSNFVVDFLASTMQKGHDDDVVTVILVFAPALKIMKDLKAGVVDLYKEGKYDVPQICHLHAGLRDDDAITSTKSRIIFATDTAESSITIDDATVVVDLCLQKESYDDNHLRFIRTAKAAMTQRKGRVGRVCHGECYRMITHREYAKAPELRTPEMERVSLDSAVLDAYSLLHTRNLDPLLVLQRCISPPDEQKLQLAKRRLQDVGAIRDGRMTAFGSLLQSLPLDLELSRFVVWASLVDHDIGRFAVEVAVMSHADIFCQASDRDGALFGTLQMASLQQCHARGFPSDIPVLIGLLHEYRKVEKKQRVRWCSQNFMRPQAMGHVESLIVRTRIELHRTRPFCPSLPDADPGVVRLREEDLTQAIVKESRRPTDEEIVGLLLIHAMAFADSTRPMKCKADKSRYPKKKFCFKNCKHKLRDLNAFSHYITKPAIAKKLQEYPIRFLPVLEDHFELEADIDTKSKLDKSMFGMPEGLWYFSKLVELSNINVLTGARRTRSFAPPPEGLNFLEVDTGKDAVHAILASSVLNPIAAGMDGNTPGCVVSVSQKQHENQKGTRSLELRHCNTYFSFTHNKRMEHLLCAIVREFGQVNGCSATGSHPQREGSVSPADDVRLQGVHAKLRDTLTLLESFPMGEGYEGLVGQAQYADEKYHSAKGELLLFVASVLQTDVAHLVGSFKVVHSRSPATKMPFGIDIDLMQALQNLFP